MDEHRKAPGGRQSAAETPMKLRRESWWSALKRSVAEFRRDNLTDCGRAAHQPLVVLPKTIRG
jgi:hypothetical protein